MTAGFAELPRATRILAATLLLLSATSARATIFLMADVPQLAAASDAVVLGRVAAIETVGTEGRVRTNVTLDVERSFKADVGPTLTLVEDGGSLDDRQRWVFGTPTYFVGERVLTFVHRTADGLVRTTFLAMGKFRVVRAANGREFAVRNLLDTTAVDPRAGRVARNHASRYRLEDLEAQIAGQLAPRAWRPRLLTQPATGTSRQPRFAFTGPPQVRWFRDQPDQAVSFSVAPDGDMGLGPARSLAAAHDAVAGWGEVPCSGLRLQVTDDAVSANFGDCDGRSQITFNDRYAEIADPVDCTGVLAIGGVCADLANPQLWHGGQVFPITEGDVLVNDGFAGCYFWEKSNLKEILTHEVGHAIGLAHSSDNPEESQPLLRQATMYFRAHFDGRGAQLQADDIAGLCSLYPSNGTAALDVQHLALIYDSRGRSSHDRLSFDGDLQIYDEQLTPDTQAVTVDIRASGQSLLRVGIAPEQWRVNHDGSRYRNRSRTDFGAATIEFASQGGGSWSVQVTASGLDLSPSYEQDITLSLTVGTANVTQDVRLAGGSGARHFP